MMLQAKGTKLSYLEGKKGLVMGVANDRSIATGISKVLHQHKAQLGFSYLPDDRGKMLQRVTKAIGDLDPVMIEPCDVNDNDSLDKFFGQAMSAKMPKIDFFLHSIAFAPLEDIRCDTLDCSRAGFLSAMESSVYSFIATAQRASKLMAEGGQIITLSYFGGEKVVPGYNLMGLCKSALESAVRYLAYELGPRNIRVNSISAGVVKTLSASAVGDFGDMLSVNRAMSPLDRNINADEVGKTALYLLSDMSSGVTGENIHLDCGYHIMGGPGGLIKKWGLKGRDYA